MVGAVVSQERKRNGGKMMPNHSVLSHCTHLPKTMLSLQGHRVRKNEWVKKKWENALFGRIRCVPFLNNSSVKKKARKGIFFCLVLCFLKVYHTRWLSLSCVLRRRRSARLSRSCARYFLRSAKASLCVIAVFV